ncbi:hypothetical protein L6164_024972 [Bauhinia variegata]|uniref:Uncharacterized protein n=1 Tax=Bauhinia variegata TaxID=167791 RepID=A0ACB9LZ53_BAUVA|nr:hypothetical protein L6164_024972 [Bauhinia variegata]
MDDSERLGQNSHDHLDVELVDATFQQQHSTSLEKDQNGESLHQEANDHKNVKSATHSHQEDQVMVDDANDSNPPDNVDSYSSPSQMPETKSVSDKIYNQKQLKDVRSHSHEESLIPKAEEKNVREMKNVLNDTQMTGYDEAGMPEERAAFMKELASFYRERAMEFKPPKFYGEPLNCLKLWRAVIKLGGYDLVTASKLWRQVGESFHPPKTCTTVSWTFRIFYEKAILEYERHKREIGELQLPIGSFRQSSSVEKETSVYQTPGSGRARRDAAARAMQGWHAQRLLGYGEVAGPIIKEKSINYAPKREKNLKSIGMINKQRALSVLEHAERAANIDGDKQLVTAVMDIGPPADWVKINVRETRDCFEVYALVPGLLREEVRVQSDPAGRLVITGQPEHVDNPWGITPFKKVVSLPARIDPLQTSAIVSLHGRLFVRVPFQQGAM